MSVGYIHRNRFPDAIEGARTEELDTVISASEMVDCDYDIFTTVKATGSGITQTNRRPMSTSSVREIGLPTFVKAAGSEQKVYVYFGETVDGRDEQKKGTQVFAVNGDGGEGQNRRNRYNYLDGEQKMLNRRFVGWYLENRTEDVELKI